MSEDIYAIVGRIKNTLAREGLAITNAGTVLCNTYALVLKDLYDFADTLPSSKALRDILGKKENMVVGVLKVLTPNPKDFKPVIKTTSFKENGKYYSEGKMELRLEHAELPGWELQTLIKRNDPSVKEYSGLSWGFSNEFTFVVEVDYGETQNFCYFTMTKDNREFTDIEA